MSAVCFSVGWGLIKSYREPCQMLMSAVYSPHPKSPPLQCLFTSSDVVRTVPSKDSTKQQIGAVVEGGRRRRGQLILWRRAIPYRTTKNSLGLFFISACLFSFSLLRIRLSPQYSNQTGTLRAHTHTHRWLVPYMAVYIEGNRLHPQNQQADCRAVICRNQS